MKLSFLVYEGVKNVKYLDTTAYTYESFKKGEFNNDLDYVNQIHNVYSPLNMALHRLSDRGKLPTKSYMLPIQQNNVYDISGISSDINEIKNVYSFCPFNGYETVEYRTVGTTTLILLNAKPNKQYYIEYVQDIPHFNNNDWRYDEEGHEVKDVDLRTYGITDTMCSYVIEYIRGNLLEPIDPQMATIHLNRAEEYMADLRDYQTLFNKNRVKNVIKL